ncbi:MAG: mshD [Ilumatobacteraceae bacterium]|nr:mshD [Ilumatobacteraceae bacterium]
MSSSPAVDHAVPGTGAVLRAEASEGAIDLGLRGDLDSTDPATVDAVAALAVELGAGRTDVDVRLLVDQPTGPPHPLPAALADRLGLAPRRKLFQMRRPLPVPADDPQRDGAPPLRLRPFDPSRDEAAWVRQNNRAFATHPSQGTQTVASLRATLAEPWVDLDGFLVSDDPDRPGELAGSCWTRIHPASGSDPVLGEIFVIGVDPEHHGRRLGRTLVLAGLDHLAWSGVTTGMLYVEADNQPALRLYERLGFSVHLEHRIFSR